MNKKGFTLVELLAVIIILGLLVGISFPIVRKSINKYKTQLCESQMDEIMNAAKLWGSDNMEALPDGKENGDNEIDTTSDISTLKSTSYETLKIHLNYLTEKNYINQMKNQKTDAPMGDIIIVVEKSGNAKWTYKFDDNTNKEKICK